MTQHNGLSFCWKSGILVTGIQNKPAVCSMTFLERIYSVQSPQCHVSRVNMELERIKIGSRVSKLFNAGDDMSSVFVIEEHVLKEIKEANKAKYNSGDGFSNFFNRISDGISGQVSEIWYVDRYTLTDELVESWARLSLHSVATFHHRQSISSHPAANTVRKKSMMWMQGWPSSEIS